MNLSGLLRIQWFVLLLSVLSCSALMADNPVTGKWQCIGKGMTSGDLFFVLDLKQSEQNVTGTVQTDSDTIPTNGTAQGNTMELITETDSNRYVSTVTIKKNKMSATWKDAHGRSGTWEGTKIE